MIRFVALIFLVFLIGCRPYRPPLDEQTYIQVRAELEMIYQIHSYTAETEKTAEMLYELQQRHEFTVDEFLESQRYYEQDLDGEIARLEQSIMQFNQERQRLEAIPGQDAAMQSGVGEQSDE